MADPLVWLIGENNPYSDDPEDALLPFPEQSAGARLCQVILGMYRQHYLAAFTRRNLLMVDNWSAVLARAAAACLSWEMGPADAVILLGRRVHDAWCSEPGNWAMWVPFEITTDRTETRRILALPHPSGLSRVQEQEVRRHG